MSVWNPDNVTDVAESVGIASLNREVAEHLARDVEYRISQVLEEALKFMRHAKRTTLTTSDVANALRLLEVEPLYGYESTRPLRFGEASIGPGQPLFYVEDDEVDFEKLINAPLPKVPREITFSAHWLAVEGVQPSIPQNPTHADQRHQELAAKGGAGAGAGGPGTVGAGGGSGSTAGGANAGGSAASSTLAAISGNDNVAIKPLVKHVLSKELQLYFERVCGAIMDAHNDEYRTAAFASLRTDPGLHQLVPYFVQFVADKVTHGLKSLFVLTQSMQLVAALLENPSLYIAPYVPALVPSVLTCLIGKHLGSNTSTSSTSNLNPSAATAHFSLRDYAASLLSSIARQYGSSSTTLKPRIARSCLKHFLDSHKPLGTHYGAILGLTKIAGADGVRALIRPHLKAYDIVLAEALGKDTPGASAVTNGTHNAANVAGPPTTTVVRREQAEFVAQAIMRALDVLRQDLAAVVGTQDARQSNGHPEGDALKDRLVDAVGSVIGTRVFETGDKVLVEAVLEKDMVLGI